ncbi:hypothetical protein AXK11_05980 [Cephaloticoccus primus]|uniref:PEP-CTERM protein-sorting domain-containing protein n=1 Tax=Cephaloticoccus primus TaxID=1548207 RepID=A0A139SLV9_9BACT|nr:hypothetical protein AXK11_05980 [Cephaloticoccus primus]
MAWGAWGSPAVAQVTLPAGIVTWGGAGADDNWATPENWASGAVPASGADVLFAKLSPDGAEQQPRVLDNPVRTLRSLWFEAGDFYTLSGPEALRLGSGLSAGGDLLVVNSLKADGSLSGHSEINIERVIQIAAGSFGGGFGRIANYSEAGLRLGAVFNLSNNKLRIGGTGATHFAGGTAGSGTIAVGGVAGERPHLIFGGTDGLGVAGAITVDAGGMAVVRGVGALGFAQKTVNSGGTLAFRSDAGVAVTYGVSGQTLQVAGHGQTRNDDTGPIGAIYSDGGSNQVNFRINMVGTEGVSFGSRGELTGGLTLAGRISGNGPFIKVGTGLITLSNTHNNWSGSTIIRGGVLRLGSAAALPSTSNIVFDGGILELGSDATFSFGTGPGQIQWMGSGGFSNSASSASSVNVGAVTWGEGGFVPTGSALLLNSRYARGNITLSSDIDLGSELREIRVERGENHIVHAQMSGKLSGSGGGILKTGRGLLYLNQPDHTYTGATLIREGALWLEALGSSNIQLDGGVLVIGKVGTTVLDIGSGAGQIQWLGDGGLSASSSFSSTVKLRLNGAEGELDWAAFIPLGRELRLGHYSSANILTWDTALNLGDGERTIRIEGGRSISTSDVAFSQALRSTAAATLNLVGNGRIDFAVDNAELKAGRINLYGAGLRLHSAGRLAAAAMLFDIRHGGRLILDNRGSVGNPNVGGSFVADRIHDEAVIRLNAGTLVYRIGSADTSYEKLGELTLDSGANAIEFSAAAGVTHFELGAAALLRAADSRSTLYFNDARAQLGLTSSASGLGINDAGGDSIIPWAAYDQGWLRPIAAGSGAGAAHYLNAIPNEGYHTGGQAGWNGAHNVRFPGPVMLNAARTVNSLVLGTAGALNTGSYTLTINSGGLLARGQQITGSGLITTGAGRPLYIHSYGTGTGVETKVAGAVRLGGGMDLVKTGPNTLTLSSTATHKLGAVYIHQGTLKLQGGTLSVSGPITIGDGAGTDILELAPDRWHQLVKTGGGFPKVILKGTPYDPLGPEYGGDQAILRLGGGTRQTLAGLHIEHRGTIDWAGGRGGMGNILWIEELTFSDPKAQLFMRNWNHFEDILLVRHGGMALSQLQQIVFEGYQDYTTQWKAYNADYMQILPFGALPEPSTYGALLGTLGLGVVAWRKRRNGRHTNEQCC